ncbi:hypothetical protein D7D52_28365 [Nocardia yunnanensis]|uniref:Uncharacterized protein n=2 Tax=Nocardia yunnanensis TaxID=2382165 RepID=A0A386ZHR1_9NOCA|nr:hypothetical protein D7D52_28365 [Nocardia yunnanensis]
MFGFVIRVELIQATWYLEFIVGLALLFSTVSALFHGIPRLQRSVPGTRWSSGSSRCGRRSRRAGNRGAWPEFTNIELTEGRFTIKTEDARPPIDVRSTH